MKPKALEKLVVELSKLPSITKKNAEKIAFHLLAQSENETKQLIDSIESLKFEVKRCSECGHISDEPICYICTDKAREKKLIIVETSQDVFKFEAIKEAHYYYHVLNGLLTVSKGGEAKELNIANLKKRSEKYDEIIIALSPNLEGIVTANYVKGMLDGKKVTQLAQGIPLGAAMEYVDEITLKLSLMNRKGDK